MVFPSERLPMPYNPAPLTFGQEQFAERRHAVGDVLWSLYLTVRIVGDLNVEAVVSSIADLVNRWDTLRLSIVEGSDGSLAQCARRAPEVSELVMLRSVRATSEEQFTGYATQVLVDELFARWDYENSYPFRFCLLRYAADHHALLASFPHFVIDDRGLRLLSRDLWCLYTEQVQRAGSHVPAVERTPFLTAARRQREQFRRRADTTNRNHWLRHIVRTPPRTQFDLAPAEMVPAAAPMGSLDRHLVTIEGVARRDLMSLCRRRRCSPFQYLLTVFAGMVFDLSSEDRIAITLPIDTRRREEASVVGMFVVDLPVVIDRPGESEDFLGSVQRAMSHTIDHRFVHDSVLREAGRLVEQRQGTRPAFNLSANLFDRTADGVPAAPPGIVLDFGHYDPREAQVSKGISMIVHVTDGALVVELVFCPRIFSPEMATSRAEEYEHRVRQLVDCPRPHGGR